MGMFDYVNFEMPCPNCGETLNRFQTKDSECTMDTVEPDGIGNFYALCKCKHWVEFSRPRPRPPGQATCHAKSRSRARKCRRWASCCMSKRLTTKLNRPKEPKGTDMGADKSSQPLGVGSSEGLGASEPKANSAALWGNLVLLHLWAAVGYVKPGWFPAMAGVIQLVLLCSVYHAAYLEAKLTRQKSA